MAENQLSEFKFPDEIDKGKPEEEKIEIEIEGDEPIKIEVVDDTPERDRGHAPMTDEPEEVTEEELSRYKDTRLRDRLSHLSKARHQERRAKESAEREREEALAIAQRILAENQELKGSMESNQKLIIDQAKTVAGRELDEAKRQFKAAHEAGDTDALLEAQQSLTTATMKVDKINNLRPKPLQTQQNDVQTQTSPPNPAREAPVDERAVAWKTRNPWFLKDREMTSLALAVHERLVEEEGISPASDTYYERIDSRMREKFPEKFGNSNGGNEKPRRSTVVAPATRSTAPRKIVLSPSAVNIAKRLGIPLELYAKKVAEEQRKENG